VVIQAVVPVTSSLSPLVKVLKNVVATKKCSQVVILWHCAKVAPSVARLQQLVARENTRNIPLHMVEPEVKLMSLRFNDYDVISNDVVLHLDDDVTICNEEMDFAFEVWREFPERIIGFPARNHVFDEKNKKWLYTSKWNNYYSIVLTGAAFIHKYYMHLYTTWLPQSSRNLVDEMHNCEDLLMNFLVAHLTKQPPIKVTQRKQYKDTSASVKYRQNEKPTKGVLPSWSDPSHFSERQKCMSSFTQLFGYMPLIRSATRMDPTLYRDDVARFRKQFPKIETCMTTK